MNWKIIAAFFLLVLGIVIFKFKKESLPLKNEPKEELIRLVEDKESIDEIVDIDSKAYSSGFEKGRDSFMLQIGYSRPHSANYSSPKTQEEYTVLIENYDDEQKERCEEIWWKGYVDGYHKATETTYCPGR